MALDERDYMVERARRLVEREYYGSRGIGQQRKASSGTHWSIVLVVWLLIVLALWAVFSYFHPGLR